MINLQNYFDPKIWEKINKIADIEKISQKEWLYITLLKYLMSNPDCCSELI